MILTVQEPNYTHIPRSFNAKLASIKSRLRVEAERPFKDEFYHNLKPLLVVLKAIGVLPVAFEGRTRGVVQHHLFSQGMFYSLLVYVIVLMAVSVVHYSEVRDLGEKSFDEKIQVLLNILFDLLVVCLPFFVWTESRPLAKFLSQWASLQLQYIQVTGETIEYSTRRRAVTMTVTVIVSSILFELFYRLQADKDTFRYIELFTSIYQDLLRNLLAVFWYLICKNLVNVSNRLLITFRQEMSSSGCHRVTEYRLMWLRLSHLARNLGQAVSYTYGFYISYLFLTLFLSVYQAIMNIAQVLSDTVALMEGIIIAWCLCLVCNSSSQVVNHLGVQWESLLLNLRSNFKSEQQLQIDEFLMSCVHCPPVMSLGNYVTVDRTLLISLTSAMATYLVVLIQFKASDSEEIHNTNQGTM